MLIVDLLIVCLTVAVAVRGYFRGVTQPGLLLAGFATGALVGSRVAPLILNGGLHDPFAPVLALPGALLLGAVGAAIVERLSYRALRRLRRRDLLDGLGGGLLAAVLCLAAVWVVGAVAGGVDSLEDSVRDSAVIDELNAVLPPPGPVLKAVERTDRLPMLAGPKPGVGAANVAIKRDPDVLAAARSVVSVSAGGHAHGRGGSGWIAADGIVVTNAHVVECSDDTTVQVEGKGQPHAAEVTWYDDVNDIAVLRAPGVSGVPALPIDVDPEPGTAAAALGFPRGGPYEVTPARLGNTSRIPGFRLQGDKYEKRDVTSFRGGIRPGNSGGPVVDGERRVVTMVFGGREGGHGSYGVPTARIRRALDRAGPRVVDTGRCDH